MKDVTIEGILYALADPVRARIYADLASAECPQSCSGVRAVKEKPIPKSSLSQHFKVLREAGLVRSERRGVELHNSTRCAELAERFGPVVKNIMEAYAAQYGRQKKAARRKK